MAKGLDHLLVADHLVNEGRLLAARFALLAEIAVGVRGNEARHHKGQRGQQHHHQRDAGADGDHKAQRAQDCHHAREQLGEAQQQAVGKLIHIGDDAADDFARGVGIDVAQRQDLQFGKRLRAHIAHHLEGDLVVDGINHPLHRGRGGHHDGDAQDQAQDARHIHLAGADNQIDGPADEHGHIQRQRHGDGGQQHRQRHQPHIGTQIFQHLFHRARLRLLLCPAHARASFLN